MSLPYRSHDDWALSVTLVCAGLIALIFIGLFVDRVVAGGRGVVWMDGQTQTYLKYQPKQGAVPDVVLITKQTPDSWQLCAQRVDSDQVDCRPIQEARKWLRERPAVKR
jgi:hypothetical protein